jgi:hypothetical protein
MIHAACRLPAVFVRPEGQHAIGAFLNRSAAAA